MKKLVVFSIIILACSSMVQAQKSAEIGLIGATSHYFGDITDQKLDKSIAPLGGLYYLHVLDSRLSLKTSFLIGNLKSSGELNEQPRSFSSQVAEMALQLQVNFLDYMLNNPSTKFSPYLGLGLGFLLFSSNHISNSYSRVTTAIPLSFGFNYSLTKRWGAGAELNIQKTFSDRI
ncbi:MAG: DUF6089 family protein, partial [Bacteroidota bacterium]|nr:DUF6089 family protein [Bacteroidota bacterium]